ncbi:MAG: TusE/DsrC/DsvC family sulfur relay protein [Peptococcaceae bacterium]
MLKSTIFRRKYLAMGPCCIREEKIWSKVVEDILQRENIQPITPEHYAVMNCVRKFYLEQERAPSVREICDDTGFKLGIFFALFPDWPHTLFITDSIVSVVLGLPVWNVEI